MAPMRTPMAAYLRKVALCGLVLIVAVAASGLLWTWLHTQTGVYIYRVPGQALEETVEVLGRRIDLR